MQQWGENYWETYSPVVNMLSVQLLLTISQLHDLETESIDFVLAFPQADLDVDILWSYLMACRRFRTEQMAVRLEIKQKSPWTEARKL
jgi:hypothetical protein